MNFSRAQAPNQDFDTLVYRVKAGDTLSAIIKRYYGAISAQQRQELVKQVQSDNPRVKNPNLLHPDQLLKLHVPSRFCAAPKGFPFDSTASLPDQSWFPRLNDNWTTYSHAEREAFAGLSTIMLGAGSAQLSMIDRTFKTNSPLLADMVENYETYKRGDITKGQYDYRRSKLVTEFSRKLGPTNILLNGGKTPSEILRVSRTKDVAPTALIERQIDKMHNLSKAASRGGVALSDVGLGIACHEIANTDNQQEMNEIFVESVGGLAGGALVGLGVAVSCLFMATPVGWVAALAIGLGGVAAGYGGSRIAETLYDASGKKIDFVGQTRIDTICSRGTTSTQNTKSILSSSAMSMF